MSEDDIVLAGGLALGLLDGDERTDALRRMLAEPAFAREVERWRVKLAGLDADWPEAEPDETVARRILSRPGKSLVSEGWRWAAVGFGLAAAALLTLLLVRPDRIPVAPPMMNRPAPTLVAVLAPKNADAVGIVIDAMRRTARIEGVISVPADHVAELWLIGRDGVPKAAALLPNKPSEDLNLRHGIVPVAGTVLAVSIEPAGGSPASTPTGPVVATGTIVTI